MENAARHDEQRTSAQQGEQAQDELHLVRMMREDQGSHECEILGSGLEASESAHAWKSCTKNPGHSKFIPVSEFNLEHLPLTHRTEEILDQIRSVSERTVRLKVGCTSWDRPDGYNFSNHRGSEFPRLGSGWVERVYNGSGPCPCDICTRGSSPCLEWYRIYVYTVCHVVYNSEEALAATVEFFYDDKTSRSDGTVKSLTGLQLVYKDAERDNSEFICVTHDKDLAMRLKRASTRINFISGDTWRHPESSDGYIAVIISHPHGQAKQITIGEWVEFKRTDGDSGWPSYRQVRQWCEYPTATCPGSSGAPVLVFEPKPLRPYMAYHSGFFSRGNVNYSGITTLLSQQ